MWFKLIDKTQFRTYVRQDARLNTAYWLATKVVHLCETRANMPSLKARIAVYRRKIHMLINLVVQDLLNQEGLTKDLIKQYLEYTMDYCQISLNNISQRIHCAQSGEEMPSEVNQVDREMEFIRNRTEIIPGDDLLEEFDRGIYLIYQTALTAYGSSDLSDTHMTGIKQRLDTAYDIMQPGFVKIQRHCNAYTAHLNLEPTTQLALTNQQIVDLSGMFNAGLSLAKFSRVIFDTANRLQPETISEVALTHWQDRITDAGNAIQDRLIEINLARSNNILKALG
ncbi:MAG: hypothetical protein NZ730_09200 [Porticoccaceae bacterium]|nr:hypothetical protein [Porticoccaceae bacterium]